MDPTLTIFTPTHNRAHLLPRVFDSLARQSCHDFIWLVIDDGSTDNTRSVIAECSAAARFCVEYIYQPNAGKHNAHNAAVIDARTELFAILDSDDELLPNAVATIVDAWREVSAENDNVAETAGDGEIAGIWMLCVDHTDSVIGKQLPAEVLDATLQELRYRYDIYQDMFACFTTDVLRRYLFPATAPGKCPYIPEGYVWSRITERYRLRFMNRPCCRKEYQPTGISASSRKEYRWSACIVYGYLQPLTTDLPWFWSHPIRFAESAIQAARYGLYAGQFRHLLGTVAWQAKVLLVGAVPLAILLVVRDWLSGRIARHVR